MGKQKIRFKRIGSKVQSLSTSKVLMHKLPIVFFFLFQFVFYCYYALRALLDKELHAKSILNEQSKWIVVVWQAWELHTMVLNKHTDFAQFLLSASVYFSKT